MFLVSKFTLLSYGIVRLYTYRFPKFAGEMVETAPRRKDKILFCNDRTSGKSEPFSSLTFVNVVLMKSIMVNIHLKFRFERFTRSLAYPKTFLKFM